MRILILSTIFFIAFYSFRNNSFHPLQKTDSVKMKQGAPKRGETQAKKEIRSKIVPNVEKTSTEDSGQEDSNEISYEESAVQNSQKDAGRKISAEIEKVETHDEKELPKELKWDDELAQVLDEVDPENAEEIFKSYIEQKQNFEASLQNLVREENDHQDIEYLISELEMEHEERLKEIFGPHFDQIKEHQSNFLELESR